MSKLREWANRHGGIVFGFNTGFRLPDGSIAVPDASWLSRPRWDALTGAEKAGFAPLCPDAVFELPRRASDVPWLRGKMRAYITNGAKIAVLVDRHGRTVEVYRPGREPEIYAGPVAVPLDPELPDFVLDARRLFER